MNTYTTTDRDYQNLLLWRIEDFGAKGDGVSDDGPAFMAAMKAILDADEKADKVLLLKADTTYRILTTDEKNGATFNLNGAHNFRIAGNRTKVAVKLPCGGFNFQNCVNGTIAGIELYYNPSPMFVGKIERFTKDGEIFDFIIDPNQDCGFGEGKTSFELPKYAPFFMVPDDDNRRQDFFIHKMELTSPGHLRIYQDVSMVANKIDWYMQPIQEGDVFILPRADLAHKFPAALAVCFCKDMVFDSIQIHDIPCFTAWIWCNGALTFRNVHLEPAEGDPNHLVAWRDGFHIKNQYEPCVWDNCSAGMLGDDIFNIATTLCNVIEVTNSHKFTAYTHEGGMVLPAQPGDTVGFLDMKTCEFVGEAKILSFEKGEDTSKPATIILDADIEGLKPGLIMQITYDSHNPIGHIIKNSHFVGSFRIKAPTLIENTTFRSNIMYICNEQWHEGPVPRHITMRNVDMVATMPGQTWLNARVIPTNEELLKDWPNNNLALFVFGDWKGTDKEQSFKTRDIRFENCRIVGAVNFNGNDVQIVDTPKE